MENIENLPGKGIKGIFDGKRWFAGSARLIHENGVSLAPQLKLQADEWAREAKTTVWFADNERTYAVAAIADRIKESSAAAIGLLKKRGIDVYMLTGDSETTAREMAAKAGIEHYRASVLPHEKAAFVKQLQDSGNIVAMVGDGINDSAALAQADMSIAMGTGSDIAMDTAQMTIISSDLLKIPEAIRLSGLTVKTIHQNLFWAFFYNLTAVPVAAGILYPFTGFTLNPMIAGLAMALSSITVVANSLRLKRKKICNPITSNH
jgi:Cu2+-exporting ATPase